jgi:hypothetical protein
MLTLIKSFFQKEQPSCDDCAHISLYRDRVEKVLPNKSVQIQEKVYRYCKKGEFKLEDTKPCSLYSYTHYDGYNKRSWRNAFQLMIEEKKR